MRAILERFACKLTPNSDTNYRKLGETDQNNNHNAILQWFFTMYISNMFYHCVSMTVNSQ